MASYGKFLHDLEKSRSIEIENIYREAALKIFPDKRERIVLEEASKTEDL
jgi:hypothetical protein